MDFPYGKGQTMKNLLTLNVSDTQVLYNMNDNGCVELSLYPAGL